MPRGRPRKYGPVHLKSLAGKGTGGVKRGRPSKSLTKSAMNISRKVSVFPEFYPFTGRFFYASGLSSSGTTQNVFGSGARFDLNSIVAPRNSVNSHAMLGWTELNGLYRRYKVDRVKVNIKFTNAEADGLVAAIWFQAPGALNNIVGKTLEQMGEKQDVFLKYLNNSGSQVITFTKTLPIYRACNITKKAFDADLDDYCALMANAPARIPTMKVAVCNTADATGKTIAYTVEIIFQGKCYERKMMAISDPTA